MAVAPVASELERRKRVRLRLRGDLSITPQKYEGKTFYVVKDPVSLRYYRFKEQEYFLLGFMDGKHTLDEAQKEYERRFRPERLTLEDLESFAQQLLTAGLAMNESPAAGKQLLDRRTKRQRKQILQKFTNILYIKIPLYDPDVLLQKMVRWVGFFFSLWFFALSLAFMLGAALLVTVHFDTFRSKLPSYHEFFSFKTVIYLWIALGVVKVIHEFGHGLSCKKFGGEVHEMGFLFLVFSPCLYCNVSDSWTLPSKWKRIVISAAGIYIELIIAALATFVWWNTPTQPFINNLSLSLMVVCSVSTVVFNANPLMRYDGYYVLADWIEIPNLRERANRYLSNLFQEHCLGIEVQPEPYMAPWRRFLFVFYAIVSYIYRWIITFVILWFLYNWLKPYKLGVLSGMLAMAALASMVGMPIYKLVKNINRRGRLPDMKPARVAITVSVFAALLLVAFTVPLPVSRVHAQGVVELDPDSWDPIYVQIADNDKAILQKLSVKDGTVVQQGQPLAVFSNREYDTDKAKALREASAYESKMKALQKELNAATDPKTKARFEEEVQRAKTERDRSSQMAQHYDELIQRYGTVRASRAGVISVPPSSDDVGKLWDKKTPLCKISDLSVGTASERRLRIVIPITPTDYHLLKTDLDRGTFLRARVRIAGMGDKTWRGKLERLPEAEASTIPLLLSNKTGGPVAVKPGSNEQELIPQTQQYLAYIEVVEPGADIAPGVRANVKIYCEKRTVAWWVWWKINDLFNLGLI